MTIELNHTIIPSHDNVAAAKLFARIFACTFVQEWGSFAVVKVNETLTFDFANSENFNSMHYAFKVSEQEFDEIFRRVKDESLSYGSGPSSHEDGEINTNYNGRGVYFKDLDGHLLEIITTDYILD